MTTAERQRQQIRDFPLQASVSQATFLSLQTLSLNTRGSPRKSKSLSCCIVVVVAIVVAASQGSVYR